MESYAYRRSGLRMCDLLDVVMREGVKDELYMCLLPRRVVDVVGEDFDAEKMFEKRRRGRSNIPVFEISESGEGA